MDDLLWCIWRTNLKTLAYLWFGMYKETNKTYFAENYNNYYNYWYYMYIVLIFTGGQSVSRQSDKAAFPSAKPSSGKHSALSGKLSLQSL